MSMDAPILRLDKVRKVYRRGLLSRRETFSLAADLAFPRSRIVGVIGPNGAGKTTLFELITGNNTPSEGRVVVAGRNMHDVKVDERDRLAIHYHQSYQVRRFVSLRPSFMLRSAQSEAPIVHLFDEPQFNTQDGYIGFMLAFFRKLRAEGKLVFMSLHPTASYHLEILREIAEEFLVVGGGRVERRGDFKSLAADPAVQAYLGPDLAARAGALA
jgi:ABC-type branched-subunit amino acid transport system ATPase component